MLGGGSNKPRLQWVELRFHPAGRGRNAKVNSKEVFYQNELLLSVSFQL